MNKYEGIKRMKDAMIDLVVKKEINLSIRDVG